MKIRAGEGGRNVPPPKLYSRDVREFVEKFEVFSVNGGELPSLKIAAAYYALLSAESPSERAAVLEKLKLTPQEEKEVERFSRDYLRYLKEKRERTSSGSNRALLRWIQIGVLLLLVVTAGVGSFAYYQYRSFGRYIDTPQGKGEQKVSFTIPKGASPAEVAEILHRAGVVEDGGKFYIFIRYHHYLKKIYPQLRGDGIVRLRAGTYRVQLPLTPRELVSILRKGPPRKAIKVTIPEGFNIWKIAARLEKYKICRAEDFLNYVRDPKNVRRLLGWDAPSLEGYLFPDTYYFYKNTPPDKVAKKMVERFKKVFNREFRERAKQMGWTIHQVVTLASIIEKETGQAKERPLISSVFHNRLRRNWKLESDPTVIYGLLPHFNGNITQKDLHNPHPYNTYKHRGLPPGPIASPGLAAIRAALYPPKTKYMFFVSRNDGSHVFSRTGKEHRHWVEVYQKRRRKKK